MLRKRRQANGLSYESEGQRPGYNLKRATEP